MPTEKTLMLRAMNAYDRTHHASRVYLVKHRKELMTKNKIYRDAHKEQIAARDSVWKRDSLLLKYGLSEAIFDVLLNHQGGVCAICGKANWNGKRPCIDHDHANGRIRGILCRNCNMALGMIKDDPKIAQAMIDYLGTKETK